jgi:hypothetical protein
LHQSPLYIVVLHANVDRRLLKHPPFGGLQCLSKHISGNEYVLVLALSAQLLFHLRRQYSPVGQYVPLGSRLCTRMGQSPLYTIYHLSFLGGSCCWTFRVGSFCWTCPVERHNSNEEL